MKKIFLSLLLIAAGLTAFAAPSARVKIAINTSSVTVRQDATSEVFEAFGNPAIVINVAGVKYSQWQGADVEGLAIDYLPKAESFNLTFSNVIGDLYLVDKQANSRTKIVDGGTYPVTATAAEVAAGAYISNRFAISKIAGPEFCFNYNKLTVKGYVDKTLKVMKGADVVVAEKKLSDNEEFDLSAQSGRLVVTLDGKEYQIDANPAVTEVKP
jgi:hypothetical protein